MSKKIIGALVGGIIIFLIQFISWAPGEFHKSALQYTPRQDSILSYLGNQLTTEGGYYLPTSSPNATSDEKEALLKASEGKPWVQIFYHKEFKSNMLMNMLRGLLTDIIVVWLFIWLISKMSNISFTGVFMSSLAVGLIVFLNSAYTGYIWFQIFDMYAYLTDAILGWGLTGVWLGWWMNRKK
ncbi:MAG TPA: hypothetical protein VFN30_02385 [Chitinophagaceae bacterium]|nr:hypothetical protein [Chitinophagaceae bacterium]